MLVAAEDLVNPLESRVKAEEVTEEILDKHLTVKTVKVILAVEEEEMTKEISVDQVLLL
jgi:hypothetical protein